MKGPEGAVPEDQWVACPQLRCFDLAHAEVMVAGRVRLDQAALEPRGAAVEEWDAVPTESVWEGAPLRIDRGRTPGEAIGDELLGAGEDADVELPGFDDRGAGDREVLEGDSDEGRLGRHRDEAARGQAAELVTGPGADHDHPRGEVGHGVEKGLPGHVGILESRFAGGDVAKWEGRG